MDDIIPQTDCEARTDREVESPPSSSSSNSSTDTTSPVEAPKPRGFFVAAGEELSSSSSVASPISDGNLAEQVDGLTEILAAIGHPIGRTSGRPDEPSFGDDGGPDRQAEMSVAAETARQVHFLLKYGDYAGTVWNVLRRLSQFSDRPLPDSVVSFDDNLNDEDQDDDEELSGADGAWQTLRRLISQLDREEGIRIDERMARSAIRVYALRNVLCHRSNGRCAQQPSIANDARDVERWLPDELHQDRATWERIVRSSADLREWLAQAPFPGTFTFRDVRPNYLQREELTREFDRGLRHDRLNQMHGKDGEAKHLNQPRPDRAGSDPLPYVPTMDPTYSPSRR